MTRRLTAAALAAAILAACGGDPAPREEPAAADTLRAPRAAAPRGSAACVASATDTVQLRVAEYDPRGTQLSLGAARYGPAAPSGAPGAGVIARWYAGSRLVCAETLLRSAAAPPPPPDTVPPPAADTSIVLLSPATTFAVGAQPRFEVEVRIGGQKAAVTSGATFATSAPSVLACPNALADDDMSTGCVAVAGGVATITGRWGRFAAQRTFTVSGGTHPPPPPPPPPDTAAPPPGGLWPREPAGFVVIAEHHGSALTPAPKWHVYNPAGRLRVVPDAEAPTAPTALEWEFPVGLQGGGGPGATLDYGTVSTGPNSLRLPDGGPVDELYVGLWFKLVPAPSTPDRWWTAGTGHQKMFYLFQWQDRWPASGNAERHDIVPFIMGPVNGAQGEPSWGPPFRTEVGHSYGQQSFHYGGNTGARPPIRVNTWHRFELHTRRASAEGAADGLIRWWVDGVLVGDYPNVPRGAVPFTTLHINPVLGGGGGTLRVTEWLRYDAVRVSGRSAPRGRRR